MEAADIGILGIAGILLAAAAASAAVLSGCRRRQKLLSILRSETLGLSREVAELAEAICSRQADGRIIDQDVLDRYSLTEPQTYPGLIPSLWRLPTDLAGRAVEFHGQLCLARSRLAAWRRGERGSISTYLLVSALTRSANSGDGILRESTRRLGWPTGWKPEMPLASALVEGIERTNPELLDGGYWSPPA
ncbi:hypothetical protein GCM10009116_04100 [Brevundimonas basaltis]|uniref:Uncharacterized protein n=1 Tax=Brevundimonas basaltis TaxID=472166 RepID=A0A7W8MHI5_9CAUL|nr:hypothetical protein [Brevundimonas basaltis]MBB5292679.1 hypothetical protein [Brevundimonas basaltis]